MRRATKLLFKYHFITGEAATFFKDLYASEYRTDSSLNHQLMGAVGQAFISDDPELQWSPGLMDSNVAISAAFYLLCILSEVEVLSRLGANVNIRVAWERLLPTSDMFVEAKALRYGRLLSLDEKVIT